MTHQTIFDLTFILPTELCVMAAILGGMDNPTPNLEEYIAHNLLDPETVLTMQQLAASCLPDIIDALHQDIFEPQDDPDTGDMISW